MSETEVDAISTALSLTDNELYVDLANSVHRYASPSDGIRKGKELFENFTANSIDILCTESMRKLHQNQNKMTDIQIVAAIVDVIIGHVIGFKPATIAVLIFKRGLSSICSKQWTDKNTML